MLATEEPTAPVTRSRACARSLLEQWPQNERMRHVPPIPWIIQKLDQRRPPPHREAARPLLRRRLERSAARGAGRRAARALPLARPRRLRRRTRPRHGHAPNDLAVEVRWSLDHAVQNLNAADADTFGRRFPMQTFERSNAEPLWGAMLAVIQHVQKLVPLIREIEPDIDERMYEGLVNAQRAAAARADRVGCSLSRAQTRDLRCPRDACDYERCRCHRRSRVYARDKLTEPHHHRRPQQHRAEQPPPRPGVALRPHHPRHPHHRDHAVPHHRARQHQRPAAQHAPHPTRQPNRTQSASARHPRGASGIVR